MTENGRNDEEIKIRTGLARKVFNTIQNECCAGQKNGDSTRSAKILYFMCRKRVCFRKLYTEKEKLEAFEMPACTETNAQWNKMDGKNYKGASFTSYYCGLTLNRYYYLL